jgi:hypothetical protein
VHKILGKNRKRKLSVHQRPPFVPDYLKKQENKSLLARLNEAYEDFPNDNEQNISKLMRLKHDKIIEQEPW